MQSSMLTTINADLSGPLSDDVEVSLSPKGGSIRLVGKANHDIYLTAEQAEILCGLLPVFINKIKEISLRRRIPAGAELET